MLRYSKKEPIRIKKPFNNFENIPLTVICVICKKIFLHCLSISQRVERILQTHDSSQPLFMYMAFQNVHAPIQAPEKYIEKYEFIKDKTRRVHAAMADILDEAVGNITDAFEKAGLVTVETIWDFKCHSPLLHCTSLLRIISHVISARALKNGGFCFSTGPHYRGKSLSSRKRVR